MELRLNKLIKTFMPVCRAIDLELKNHAVHIRMELDNVLPHTEYQKQKGFTSHITLSCETIEDIDADKLDTMLTGLIGDRVAHDLTDDSFYLDVGGKEEDRQRYLRHLMPYTLPLFGGTKNV